MEASVEIVGMGLSPGQLTVAGARALAACPWRGHYGLPLAVRAAFLHAWPDADDLDARLDAATPAGFIGRLGALLAAAARRHGSAALAVAGHPVPANAATTLLCGWLGQQGIAVALHAAPSALDHFMAATGIDLVAHGVSLVDARAWLAQEADHAGRAVAVWNAAYLDGAGRATLLERLRRRFPPAHPVTLFRIVGMAPRIERYPLEPAAWLERVDAETTLLVY